MFTKTFESITRQLQKTVDDLYGLANKEFDKADDARVQAEDLQQEAESHSLASVKARNVANKLSDLLK